MTTDLGSNAVVADALLTAPINHLAYTVQDIAEAVGFWSTTMGAGPFFLFDHIEFEHLSYQGAPAVFSHSAAFGQWGSLVVELQQLHDVAPKGLLDLLDRGMNHIAYVSDDAGADSAALEASGLPMFLHAGFGPLDVRFHYLPLLGHSIELHQRSPFLDDFFAGLHRAAQDWDGTDPLRASLPQDAPPRPSDQETP